MERTRPRPAGLGFRQRHPVLARERSVLVWVLGGLAVLAVAAQLLATPLARHSTRKSLEGMEGYRGRFEEVTASVFPPRYTVRGLSLWSADGGPRAAPLFEAERIRVTVNWRKLLRLSLVASVWMDRPSVNMDQRSRVAGDPGRVDEQAKSLPDLAEKLEARAPLRIDEIFVTDGKAVFRDRTRPGTPTVQLTRLEGTLENLATRRILSGDEPSRLRATGLVQGAGKLEMHAEADPWQKELDFHAKAQVLGLPLRRLAELTEAEAGLHAKEGTLDLFVELRAEGGALTGGVRPILHGVELATKSDALFDKLRAWVADKGVDLLSDERDRTATTIPIKGRVDEAQVQSWPAVLGLVRNAFVEGVGAGFSHLPPPTAKKKQGVLEQAWNALKKDEGPPKAQPTADE